MIETHVHFNIEALEKDIDGALARALAADVGPLIVVGFDRTSSAKAVTQAQRHPMLYATVGVHPHDARHYDDATEAQLVAWASEPKVVAIGEIGLDFYRDLSPRPEQYAAFRRQLALARAADLPVVIHCRDAYDECIPLLEAEADGLTIILHCFAGERAHAEVAWARGWFLGIDGPITYKKNDTLRAVVRETPAELLLLETDAPYLSPEPLRSKFPNEPARLPLICNAIAAVRGVSSDTIAAQTTTNAHRAFPRLPRT